MSHATAGAPSINQPIFPVELSDPESPIQIMQITLSRMFFKKCNPNLSYQSMFCLKHCSYGNSPAYRNWEIDWYTLWELL